MRSLTGFDWTALVLAIVGCLNWGLIAISTQFDVVALILGGASSVLARIVYGLIGLSAIYLIFAVGNFARR